jgi:uncharacterized MAPEG superfamily protein
MAVAVVAGVVGRLGHSQKVVPSAAGVAEVVFAAVVISALDSGRTQEIAQGFAWLFLAAVLLSKYSPLTALANVVNAKPKPAPKSAPKKGRR